MEETNRIGVIYNPHSGFDKSRKRWELIKKYMEKKGVQYDFLQSETPDSVERLAKMMCENGYGTIVVVGGDGSLNRAVNAIMQCRESLPEDFALPTSLMVLPMISLASGACRWMITNWRLTVS